MKKKIVAVDFDGVLHSFASGWVRNGDMPDPPADGAIEWLISLIYSDEFEVVIFSSRNENSSSVLAMRNWLVYRGISREQVEALDFPTKKPAWHILIDDRCFCFEGKFPSVSELNEFVPWHGKGVW